MLAGGGIIDVVGVVGNVVLEVDGAIVCNEVIGCCLFESLSDVASKTFANSSTSLSGL